MASVRDIAKAAGVSPATVSKVINARDGVNAQTAAKVRGLMDAMGYRPKAKAVDSRRVLVLVAAYPDAMLSPYVWTVFAGVSERCMALDIPVSLRRAPVDLTSGELKQLVRQDGSRGVVLIAQRGAYHVADRLGMDGLPHVVIGSSGHDEMVNQIIVDDEVSAYNLTRLCIERGHRRILWLGFSRTMLNHAARIRGHLRALQEFAPELEPNLIELNHAGETDAQDAVSPFFSRSPQNRPTVVIGAFQEATIAALALARQRGISVPGDVSFCFYDSSCVGANLAPALSAMQEPLFDMGAHAADMLCEQYDGVYSDACSTLHMSHRFIDRGSIADIGGAR